jgi:signal transduction histidine kinase
VRLSTGEPFVRAFAFPILLAGVAIATAALVWFGYLATYEWQRNAKQLVERRAAEVLALLTVELSRDMKGAQLSVLMPLDERVAAIQPPFELREAGARAFARFPYPESFFVWRDSASLDGLTYFINRADRRPPWDSSKSPLDPYPALLLTDPPPMRPLLEKLRDQSAQGRRFALLETELSGDAYQIVAHLFYGSGNRLSAMVGFTVNMDWVRADYFGDIVQQLARISGEAEAMTFSILDDRGEVVMASGGVGGEPVRERRFPLLFFDPDLAPGLPSKPVVRYWTARVQPSSTGGLDTVTSGARRTFILIAAAALAMACGLLITARAVRARAEFAAMQSEFVSTVTHELKTPLALIRLVSETLVRGRFSSAETIRDYAGLLSQETSRLTRLIDNLLTFARLAEHKKTYTLETIHMIDLVEDAVEHFLPRLDALQFHTTLDVSPDLPGVCVDRSAMLQVIENLVDNAIKYSGDARSLAISGRVNGKGVTVAVKDTGIGIPPDEISHVFEKFFRGRNSAESGSGLGLTIARRIVNDHGGEIAIQSSPETGTVVEITLPVGQPV